MKRVICHFTSDQEGAVTVDWVVLTAAIIGISLGVVMAVTGSTVSFSDRVGTSLYNHEPGGNF